MLPTVLTAMGVVAAVLLGVWGIVARYDSRVENRMDRLRNRMDAQSKETTDQLGQLRDRMDAQGKETGEQLGTAPGANGEARRTPRGAPGKR